METDPVAEWNFNLFLLIMCLVAIPIYLVEGLIIFPLCGLGKLAPVDKSSKKYLESLSQKMREYSGSSAPLSINVPSQLTFSSPLASGRRREGAVLHYGGSIKPRHQRNPK